MFDPEGFSEEKGDYAQCILAKEQMQQVAWIPSQFAKVGSVVKIKAQEKWEDGWIIQAVYGKEGHRNLRKNEEFRRRMKKHSSIARSS